MPVGPVVRSMFGRHEHRIAELYRNLFIDLDDFASKVRRWGAGARRILEVGCGEGAVTEKLAIMFPDATILAVDITPRVGRLYRGSKGHVEFRTATVQDVARDHAEAFDLIVMSDVIHHIPVDLRGEIIYSVGQAMAPASRFILKDWSSAASPIHWLCHASDRWLTGDHVVHISPEEAKCLVVEHIPTAKAVVEDHIKPWRNNYALVFAR